MFINNKYTKIYYQIIDSAKNRVIETYTEEHHILPEALGGPDVSENKVELTAREHFICHWLLTKMTSGIDRAKMIYALNGMKRQNKFQERYNTKITARVYENLRIEFSTVHSETMKGRTPWNKGGVTLTEDQYANIKHAANNRKIDPVKQAEGQLKRIAKVTGQTRTDETKKLMSLAKKGKPKGPQSDEHRKAISEGGKGVKKREGHADNVRKANLGVVSINKDGKEKKVKQDTIDQWLADGWQLGGRKRKL